MKTRYRRYALLSVLLVFGCDSPAGDMHSLEIPMQVESLVGGDYVVFPKLGTPGVPGDGYRITFNADSTVESDGPGFAGRWAIVDDSTVSIAATSGEAHRLFRVRIPDGVMISPETTSVTHTAEVTIAARGSMKTFSIGR